MVKMLCQMVSCKIGRQIVTPMYTDTSCQNLKYSTYTNPQVINFLHITATKTSTGNKSVLNYIYS